MSLERILYQAKTKFNDILVTQEGNVLTLYSPPKVRQTAIDAFNPTLSHLEYARNILLGLAFTQNPETILVMGLGGGAIPMMLRKIHKRFSIDVVEIDPEIAIVAQKYFQFKTTEKIHLFIEDAFQFIKKSEKKYDIVILDTYRGNDLPLTMSTFDFFKETNSHLSNKGILIANLMTAEKSYLKKMLKTISSVFCEIWLLRGETSSNTIAFAMNRKLTQLGIGCRALLLKKDFPANVPLMKLIRKIKKFQHRNIV